jgi:hypothetical protein
MKSQMLVIAVIGVSNGMSEILMAGITRPRWTYTRFLSARPIHDTYGTVETPDNAGLVDPSDAAIVGEIGGRTLNERARARTADRKL